MALAAVATLAVAAVATPAPAHAQRGLGAGIAAGDNEFAGYAHGLFTPRTLIQDVPVVPEPTATTRTVVPEQPVTRTP